MIGGLGFQLDFEGHRFNLKATVSIESVRGPFPRAIDDETEVNFLNIIVKCEC